MQPLHDSSADRNDSTTLAARAADDGYLFFRGLLPVSDVINARCAILPDLDALGWIDRDGPNDVRAVARPGCFVDDAEPQVGEMVCRHTGMPEVQRLQHHPELLATCARLFGESVLPLPRILLRYNFPQQAEHTTSQHQDYPHVQGTDRFYNRVDTARRLHRRYGRTEGRRRLPETRRVAVASGNGRGRHGSAGRLHPSLARQRHEGW